MQVPVKEENFFSSNFLFTRIYKSKNKKLFFTHHQVAATAEGSREAAKIACAGHSYQHFPNVCRV